MELLPINSLDEIKIVKTWLEKDKIGIQELSEYLNFENWYRLLDSKKRLAFFIVQKNLKIGFIDLEIEDDNLGYFSFYIIQQKRRQGNGSEAIKCLIKLCLDLKLEKLCAGVHENNYASKSVMQKFGFVRKKTKEEYIYFELNLKRHI